MAMRENTCCFTGHRNLPKNKIEAIVLNLDLEIDNFIAKGVTDFISGGALGFDQIAASLIIAKKELGENIRLIFALPCKNQDKFWSEQQRILYQGLLQEADEISYVSEEYNAFCMKKRNNYMVERSAYCICALLQEKSGTGQTVQGKRSADDQCGKMRKIFCGFFSQKRRPVTTVTGLLTSDFLVHAARKGSF